MEQLSGCVIGRAAEAISRNLASAVPKLSHSQWRDVRPVSEPPEEHGNETTVLRGRPHQGLRHVLRQQRLHARI